MSETKGHPLTGGDDLQDNLDLQADYMVPSDDEDEQDPDALMSNIDGDEDATEEGEGGDAAAFLSDEEAVPPVSSVGQKRKAEDDVSDEEAASSKGAAAASNEDKKKKRKLKEKERKEKRKLREEEALQPSEMTSEELGQFLYDSLKKTYSRATDMELADLRIPPNMLQSTSSFTEPRDLSSLPAFVKSQIPPLPKRLKRPGTPSLIVLSPSGIRAADIVRGLKGVTLDTEGQEGKKAEQNKPPGEVAKLFAKHFKVSEQIEHLEKTKIWAAAGTPARIAKILADSDALTIRQQTVLLLDLSYRDSKNRTLLSIPEVRDEFWKCLFGDKKVRDKMLATGVKIAVY